MNELNKEVLLIIIVLTDIRLSTLALLTDNLNKKKIIDYLTIELASHFKNQY